MKAKRGVAFPPEDVEVLQRVAEQRGDSFSAFVAKAAIQAAHGEYSPANMVSLRLEEIRADPAFNLRSESVADEELVASVKSKGVLEPVLVRESDRRLVLGFRRYDAARQADLAEIPVVLGEWDDGEILEMQLVENLQREDLGPMEEARALKACLETGGLEQKDLAKRIGKSQPWISNRLRLLKLPERAQRYVDDGKLTPKVADRLLTLKSQELRQSFADDLAERAKDQGRPVQADRVEYSLKRARMVEEFLEKAKITKCPECGHLQTPLNTEDFDIGGYGTKDAICCGSCRCRWDSMTGRVLDHGRKYREQHVEKCQKERSEREADKQKEKAKQLAKDKKAQLIAPYIRSSHNPLEWLASLGIGEEDLVRLDLGRQPSWYGDGGLIVRLHLRKDFQMPFLGRIRSMEYTSGHRSQVLLGESAAANREIRYYSTPRDAGKLKRLHKAASEWEKGKIGEPLQSEDDLKDPMEPDLSVLEGNVEKIRHSIGSFKKGRPEGLPLIEWLERVREAEVQAKNRKGVVEILDLNLKRLGDRVS